MKEEDVQLDEILANGSLGGPQYDRILQRVLDRTVPTRRRRSIWMLAWLAVPSAAVAAGWLLLASQKEQHGFTSKGGTEVVSGAIDIGCSTSGPRVCRPGDVLVFTVNTVATSGYLGAYAERIGDPARGRIWYFPNGAGSSPVVPRGTGTIAIRDAIEIGPEHEPGSYRVTAWISADPIERSQLGSAGPQVFISRADLELKVAP